MSGGTNMTVRAGKALLIKATDRIIFYSKNAAHNIEIFNAVSYIYFTEQGSACCGPAPRKEERIYVVFKKEEFMKTP